MEISSQKIYYKWFEHELYVLQHNGEAAYGAIIDEKRKYFEAIFNNQKYIANQQLFNILTIIGVEEDPHERLMDLRRFFIFLAGSFAYTFSQKLSFSWNFLATSTALMKTIEGWESEQKFYQDVYFITDILIEALDAANLNRTKSPHVIKFVNYVRLHIDEPINIKNIAEALSISPGYLSRLVSYHLGVSCKRYIRNKKLERSLLLLREKHFSIQKIAEQSGFKNQSHFIRIFKERYQMTPNRYRNQLINEWKIYQHESDY